MHASFRAAVPLAVLAGLAAATPAVAADQSGPVARAAGGDTVELTYPSIVRVRVARTERALERATNKIENGKPAKAATTMKVVRRQMAAAWRGAKYVIRTTPPPPAEEARVRRRAHASGDPQTGPVYAQPPDTGFRVLTLQHDVAAATVQLIDGSHGTGLDALSRTLFFSLDRRDKALQDILTLAPPAPPEEGEEPEEPAADAARVRAHAAGDPVVATFDTVMPNVVPQLDDETQAIVGTQTDATDLTAGGRRLLTRAADQVARSKVFVNTHWPPIPQED